MVAEAPTRRGDEQLEFILSETAFTAWFFARSRASGSQWEKRRSLLPVDERLSRSYVDDP